MNIFLEALKTGDVDVKGSTDEAVCKVDGNVDVDVLARHIWREENRTKWFNHRFIVSKTRPNLPKER